MDNEKYTKITYNVHDDLEHKIYICNMYGKYLSPFHDIPIYPNESDTSIVNMIVEIPKNTRKKMEISKELPHNPIVYDKKNGKIRHIEYGDGYPANYGAIPQTWENCIKPDIYTNLMGDNDPVDCFDISDIDVMPGDIIQLKIIGCIAMIDQGEMDWKIIGININDPCAEKYNDVHDIQNIQDKTLETLIDFLENYKIPEGKPKNAFHEEIIWSKEKTIDIIAHNHEEWKKLYNIEYHEMSPVVDMIHINNKKYIQHTQKKNQTVYSTQNC